MAQSDENVLIRGFHGKIGNQVSLRRGIGKIIIANVPKKRESGLSDKQFANCTRFKMGLQWAKKVLTIPGQYEAYKSKATGWQSALNVALSDYMKPPVVTGVNISLYNGHPGDIVLVTATDNFHVRKVSLKICTSDGKVIESGLCQADQTGTYWQYTAVNSVENISGMTVTAIARDNPGHTGEMTVMVG